MYTVSQSISSFIRFMTNQDRVKEWVNTIQEETVTALKRLESLSAAESDCVMSLIQGAEFSVITAGDLATTEQGDNVTVLGFSDVWKDFAELSSEWTKLGKDDFKNKILNKLQLRPIFTDANQKVVALFNHPTDKARQDLMILNPSNIVKSSVTQYFTKTEAEHSPFMNVEVIKYLITLLEKEDKNNSVLAHQKSQILKAFNSQMNILGSSYNKFLKDNGVLEGLLTYLFISTSKLAAKAEEIVPLQWIETRIQQMRKVALESTLSLSNDSLDV